MAVDLSQQRDQPPLERALARLDKASSLGKMFESQKQSGVVIQVND